MDSDEDEDGAAEDAAGPADRSLARRGFENTYANLDLQSVGTEFLHSAAVVSVSDMRAELLRFATANNTEVSDLSIRFADENLKSGASGERWETARACATISEMETAVGASQTMKDLADSCSGKNGPRRHARIFTKLERTDDGAGNETAGQEVEDEPVEPKAGQQKNAATPAVSMLDLQAESPGTADDESPRRGLFPSPPRLPTPASVSEGTARSIGASLVKEGGAGEIEPSEGTLVTGGASGDSAGNERTANQPRMRELSEEGVLRLAETNMVTSKTEAAKAEAQAVIAKAEIETARINLEMMKISAQERERARECGERPTELVRTMAATPFSGSEAWRSRAAEEPESSGKMASLIGDREYTAKEMDKNEARKNSLRNKYLSHMLPTVAGWRDLNVLKELN